MSLAKRILRKRHVSLYCVVQRWNKAHPSHFPVCLQKLVVLSSNICEPHKLSLGASKMLKGHSVHTCIALNCEGALRRSNTMSDGTELKPQEAIPFTTLFSVRPPLSPPVHSSISAFLSALLSFLVHKSSVQITKAYVPLPVSGMKVSIKQLLTSSFGFLWIQGYLFYSRSKF